MTLRITRQTWKYFCLPCFGLLALTTAMLVLSRIGPNLPIYRRTAM